jgi:hypothetical protein
MEWKTRNLVHVFSALIIIFLVGCNDNQPDLSGDDGAKLVHMDVFKQPSCKCCGKWVDHVEEAGFQVKTKDRLNLNAIKNEFGIAPRYQSCHTGVAEGYVFEGHIPAPLIHRFLTEKPADAIGLSVPGMPVGSPGMEMGERYDSYDVLVLKSDGSSEVYAHVDGPSMAEKASSTE